MTTVYYIELAGTVRIERQHRTGFFSVERLKEALLLAAASEYIIWEVVVDGGPQTCFSDGTHTFCEAYVTSWKEVERIQTPPGGLFDPAPKPEPPAPKPKKRPMRRLSYE